VIADAKGNLFGTTSVREAGAGGGGTVFDIVKTHRGYASTVTTLVDFCSLPNCADGESPTGILIADAKGNLFGTTSGGGHERAWRHGLPDPKDCRRLRQRTDYPGKLLFAAQLRRWREAVRRTYRRRQRQPVRHDKLWWGARPGHGVRDRRGRQRLREHRHYLGRLLLTAQLR
jgi:hypothetical protein